MLKIQGKVTLRFVYVKVQIFSEPDANAGAKFIDFG